MKHEGCCGECYYWEEIKYQRGSGMKEGNCHWFPKRLRTSFCYWCGQWEISDEAQEQEDMERCKRKVREEKGDDGH